MRLRHLLPIALLALGALLAPACSSDDSSDTASGDSNERDTSSDSGDPGSNPEEVPGLDDLTESIPGMEDMGDCFSQAAAFSSLYFETLGGEDGAKDALSKAEELKEVLPDELDEDIDVITEAIGQVAEEGVLSGTDALDTEEFQQAQEAINQYFEQECSGGGEG